MTIVDIVILQKDQTSTQSIYRLLGSEESITHIHHTQVENDMNKEIKSTQSIKSILESMSRITSFNLRFESAQEYVEYVFKRDLDLMKKNPTKRI